MNEIKSAYEKGEKSGFRKGVGAAIEIIKACERNPKDNTILSMKVTSELNKLLCD